MVCQSKEASTLQTDALVIEEEVTTEEGVDVAPVVDTTSDIEDLVEVLRLQRKKEVIGKTSTMKMTTKRNPDAVMLEDVVVVEEGLVVEEVTGVDHAVNLEMITHHKMRIVTVTENKRMNVIVTVEVIAEDPEDSVSVQGVLHKAQVMREIVMIDTAMKEPEEMIVGEEVIQAEEVVEAVVMVAMTVALLIGVTNVNVEMIEIGVTGVTIVIVVRIEIGEMFVTVMMGRDAHDQGDSDVQGVTKGRAREKEEMEKIKENLMEESTMLATEDKSRYQNILTPDC